jgi:hypothetical protein
MVDGWEDRNLAGLTRYFYCFSKASLMALPFKNPRGFLIRVFAFTDPDKLMT